MGQPLPPAAGHLDVTLQPLTHPSIYRDLRDIIDDFETEGDESTLRALWLIATAMDNDHR